MKKGLTILALLIGSLVSAQTFISVGGGVMEQSNVNGNSFAAVLGVHQEIVNNIGVSAIYTKAYPAGMKFDQVQAMGFYRLEVDHSLNIKFNGGLAYQFHEELHPSFGLDLMARASKKSQIVLGWSPVIRDDFYGKEPGWAIKKRDDSYTMNTGWSHTVTMSLVIEL